MAHGPAQHESHGHGHGHGNGHEGHGQPSAQDHLHGALHGGHGHSHGPANYGRAFAIGVVLNLLFVGIEALYGWRSNSLSLLADAGHNLSDVLGLVLAWVATVLAQRVPTARRTYGLRRSSILASLGNALLLLAAVIGIAWEAIVRLQDPQPIASGTVMVVASIGILINGLTAWMFMAGSKSDLNVRGAFLHMAADAAVSAGVVLAALAMRYTGWLWLDPVTSLAIALVITVGTWGRLRDSIDLSMDAVPRHIDPEKVEAFLRTLPGVVAVHDLHIWAMSTTEVALTVHLVKPDARVDDALLERIGHELAERFGIGHATVQLELGEGEYDCPAHGGL
jgi:cobalt-zinc-cadmium efflux system protein